MSIELIPKQPLVDILLLILGTTQLAGWQPFFLVARCHTWHQMSLLRPGIIKQLNSYWERSLFPEQWSGGSGGVGGRLTGKESEYNKLTAENVNTLAGYWDNLMDIMCRDACDRHHVCRVSSGKHCGICNLLGMVTAARHVHWKWQKSARGIPIAHQLQSVPGFHITEHVSLLCLCCSSISSVQFSRSVLSEHVSSTQCFSSVSSVQSTIFSESESESLSELARISISWYDLRNLSKSFSPLWPGWIIMMTTSLQLDGVKRVWGREGRQKSSSPAPIPENPAENPALVSWSCVVLMFLKQISNMKWICDLSVVDFVLLHSFNQ